MPTELNGAMIISAAGMDVQAERLRVVAQNLANQDTTAAMPGADPYRRRTISFEAVMDTTAGGETVKVKDIGTDRTAFPQKYDPANPAADSQGYVKLPNVNSFMEIMDMREAERSYNANLSVMQASRSMANRTIDILK
jgi:flagellar basal-body rod protein FlgC